MNRSALSHPLAGAPEFASSRTSHYSAPLRRLCLRAELAGRQDSFSQREEPAWHDPAELLRVVRVLRATSPPLFETAPFNRSGTSPPALLQQVTRFLQAPRRALATELATDWRSDPNTPAPKEIASVEVPGTFLSVEGPAFRLRSTPFEPGTDKRLAAHTPGCTHRIACRCSQTP